MLSHLPKSRGVSLFCGFFKDVIVEVFLGGEGVAVFGNFLLACLLLTLTVLEMPSYK